MDFSNLPPALVAQLMGMVEDYILGCRKKFLPEATPLQPAQISELAPFFPAETLSNIRTLVLRGKQIPNPSFYSMARMMGYHNLPDFSDMTAITFVDVVVSHQEFTGDMLFHEAVHAVQYAQLGTKEFATRYVKGFIEGGCYEEIPLEKNAYELESRFSQDHAQVFSVADEVRQWIDAGKL